MKKPKTSKQDAARAKLDQLVKAARAAGAQVTVSLEEPRHMPVRFESDPEPVKLLIAESERMSQHGNNWLAADVPNHVAAEVALRAGWAYGLAAAWLRCKLKGELKPESDAPKGERLKDAPSPK